MSQSSVCTWHSPHRCHPPILSLYWIKHVLEVAAEHKGSFRDQLGQIEGNGLDAQTSASNSGTLEHLRHLCQASRYRTGSTRVPVISWGCRQRPVRTCYNISGGIGLNLILGGTQLSDHSIYTGVMLLFCLGVCLREGRVYRRIWTVWVDGPRTTVGGSTRLSAGCCT